MNQRERERERERERGREGAKRFYEREIAKKSGRRGEGEEEWVKRRGRRERREGDGEERNESLREEIESFY